MCKYFYSFLFQTLFYRKCCPRTVCPDPSESAVPTKVVDPSG